MSDRSMGVLQEADEERKRRSENGFPYVGCQHCYCIKAEMTSGRTVPHMRCCKCGDERAAAGAITW